MSDILKQSEEILRDAQTTGKTIKELSEERGLKPTSVHNAISRLRKKSQIVHVNSSESVDKSDAPAPKKNRLTKDDQQELGAALALAKADVLREFVDFLTQQSMSESSVVAFAFGRAVAVANSMIHTHSRVAHEKTESIRS